jgi:hypothetical protein
MFTQILPQEKIPAFPTIPIPELISKREVHISIEDAIHLCSRMMHGRWKTLEKRILETGDPALALLYVRRIVHGRWIEAEDVLLKDMTVAIQYAKEFLDRTTERKFNRKHSILATLDKVFLEDGSGRWI